MIIYFWVQCNYGNLCVDCIWVFFFNFSSFDNLCRLPYNLLQIEIHQNRLDESWYWLGMLHCIWSFYWFLRLQVLYYGKEYGKLSEPMWSIPEYFMDWASCRKIEATVFHQMVLAMPMCGHLVFKELAVGIPSRKT